MAIDTNKKLSDDPLLACLVLISKLKNRPFTAEALRADLPDPDKALTPNLFIEAAKRAGFVSRFVKKPLNKISNLVLPAVLLLNNGNACILNKISNKDQAEVMFPEVGEGIEMVPLSKLKEEYAGAVIFIKEEHKFESRATDENVFRTGRNWLWGTLWEFKRYYLQVILASILINLFAIAMPLFVMNVYDRVVPNFALETLWVLASGIIIVFIFDFILKTLRGYFIDLSGKKADVLLASILFKQIMMIPLSHKSESTGVQANHLKDYESLRDFFTSATVASIVDLPFILLFVAIIAFIGGPLAFVPLIAVPIVIIGTILLSIPMHKAVKESFVGGAQKNAILIEALNNLETIKTLGAEGQMLGRWQQYVAIVSKSGLKSRLYSSLASNFTTICIVLVNVLVVIWGVYLISAAEMTVGALIACTILSSRALGPLAQISNLLTRFQLSYCSLKTLNKIMATPIERPVDRKFLHREKFYGQIEFEKVSFSYSEDRLPLFENLSFTIKRGEKVAILGPMGSGKTTLLKLILQLYQSSAGNIRVDDVDIQQIDPADLRRHIGYVAQVPQLFFGTVRDNISMKAPWADDAMVLKCAQLSGADHFIRRNEAGYDMMIGEGGAGLSGGQMQTITLARALMSEPDIILLDEPSSAMDNQTETHMIKSLKIAAANKTLIINTYKTSLLELVDRIIILRSGKIVVDDEKSRVLEYLQGSSKTTAESRGDII